MISPSWVLLPIELLFGIKSFLDMRPSLQHWLNLKRPISSENISIWFIVLNQASMQCFRRSKLASIPRLRWHKSKKWCVRWSNIVHIELLIPELLPWFSGHNFVGHLNAVAAPWVALGTIYLTYMSDTSFWFLFQKFFLTIATALLILFLIFW